MKYKPAIKGEIPVVIGANFGDEGKGMMTDYLVNGMVNEGEKVICARHNGGAQAGHTVNYPDGRTFIFNSIPSGCGVDPLVIGFLGPDFFLNPIAILKEIDRFKNFFGWKPRLYFSDCQLVTPWDMYTNQTVELARKGEAHGSCGHGIFESFIRNHRTNQRKFHGLNHAYMREETLNMRSYGLTRLNDASKGKFDVATYSSWDMFIAFEDSIRRLHAIHDDFTREQDLPYRVVVEGAQGLGLSMKLKGSFPWDPHLTPSDPGLESAISAVQKLARSHSIGESLMFSPIYVTRSYLTRHGNGPMYEDELRNCQKFADDTNVYNQFQGDQRRGKLDLNELRKRVMSDLFAKEQTVPIWNPTMAVTWANGIPEDMPLPVGYTSGGKTREYVVDHLAVP
jgi:adenylosuccinate synthase